MAEPLLLPHHTDPVFPDVHLIAWSLRVREHNDTVVQSP